MDLEKREEMYVNAIFKYKNKEYILLLDDKCNRFYLKIENGYPCYLSLDEYMDINNHFFKLEYLSKFDLYFDKKIGPGDKISYPKVINVKKRLVSLALVLSIMTSLSGCGNGLDQTIKKLQNNGVTVTRLNNDCNLYIISGIENLPKNQKIGPMDIEDLAAYPYSQVCTPAQFGPNVSYDDLKATINGNKNVPDAVKIILCNGIENLRKTEFNMNYSVLNYNLSKLKIVVSDMESSGEFDSNRWTVKLSKEILENPNLFKHVLNHEVLGHGSTCAYDEERKIECGVAQYCVIIDDEGTINGTTELGFFADEAIAEIIGNIAGGEKISGVAEDGYQTEIYALSTLCDSVGIELHEFANNGINYLIEKMKEKGITNPYLMISMFDNILRLFRNSEDIELDLTPTYIAYFNELKENNKNDIDHLVSSASAYKNYISPEKYEENQNIIVCMHGEGNSYIIIFPDKVEEAVKSQIKQKPQ